MTKLTKKHTNITAQAVYFPQSQAAWSLHHWELWDVRMKTHLVSQDEHLPLQIAMLLLRLLQLSLFTCQLFLQGQELLKHTAEKILLDQHQQSTANHS